LTRDDLERRVKEAEAAVAELKPALEKSQGAARADSPARKRSGGTSRQEAPFHCRPSASVLALRLMTSPDLHRLRAEPDPG
jgi:hypothetical protein